MRVRLTPTLVRERLEVDVLGVGDRAKGAHDGHQEWKLRAVDARGVGACARAGR